MGAFGMVTRKINWWGDFRRWRCGLGDRDSSGTVSWLPEFGIRVLGCSCGTSLVVVLEGRVLLRLLWYRQNNHPRLSGFGREIVAVYCCADLMKDLSSCWNDVADLHAVGRSIETPLQAQKRMLGGGPCVVFVHSRLFLRMLRLD